MLTIAPGFAALLHLRHHVPCAGLRHQEGTLEIDAQDLVEVGFRNIEEVAGRNDAGIVDEYVDAAETGDDRRDQRVHIGRRADIAVDIGARPESAPPRPCRSHHRYRRATSFAHLGMEAFGAGEPDAACGASDDRNLVLKLHRVPQ